MPTLSPVNQFFNFITEPPSSHTSIEVHKVLITIYRIHLINLFLTLPALLLHCAVLSYTIFKEVACDKPFTMWLVVVTCINTARIVPQCIIISRASTLLSEWPNRPVAYDTSKLTKSITYHIDRVLWLASIVWFFIGFEWAYTSTNCSLLAPILYQYITILILFFLALLGMNCLLCMGSSTLLFLASILPSDRFVQLFEDRRHTNNPMPMELVKSMPLKKWTNEMKDDTEASKMCPICLVDYEYGHKLRQLPCSHWFHQSCIDQWFKNNSSCPLRCDIDLSTAKNKYTTTLPAHNDEMSPSSSHELSCITTTTSSDRALTDLSASPNCDFTPHTHSDFNTHSHTDFNTHTHSDFNAHPHTDLAPHTREDVDITPHTHNGATQDRQANELDSIHLSNSFHTLSSTLSSLSNTNYDTHTPNNEQPFFYNYPSTHTHS